MEHYLSTLRRSMVSQWKQPALCNYQGETITNEELAVYITQFGRMFAKAGIAKGDKIAVCAKNTARWAVSFLAGRFPEWDMESDAVYRFMMCIRRKVG